MKSYSLSVVVIIVLVLTMLIGSLTCRKKDTADNVPQQTPQESVLLADNQEFSENPSV